MFSELLSVNSNSFRLNRGYEQVGLNVANLLGRATGVEFKGTAGRLFQMNGERKEGMVLTYSGKGPGDLQGQKSETGTKRSCIHVKAESI